ncbi:endonuclease Q family protein [Alkalihalobacillus trypoxylicola]|uniref:TIGR00375 family protein n=1 Tax=Alkalihalobacillus trypoxylicola TaxID=519424 RepID=A0A161PYG5_9BACI|nr:endonuclease Q family protein [Alkalihalobacillus trypoxylicola]KYG27584.1 hypothetical protein AZF04_10335 [Alkalihalobacillus trypoxylicola]
MKTYFADFHIHIGRTNSGRPVKITASPSLTLENILYEASQEKGIDIVGVIDCHVPEVLDTLSQLIKSGTCLELDEGGIRFLDTTLLLGSEIEIYDDTCSGPIHVLIFLPTLEAMKQFSDWLKPRMKNRTLSSQRIYESGIQLQQKVKELNGLFIPAHIFTPFKSLYGKGVKHSLKEVFDPTLIDAVELGLSSDTEMVKQIKELNSYTFLTNSDAHSLAKIGREYQKLCLKDASFKEVKLALSNQKGRYIKENYGLNPKLGKYYLSTCENCSQTININHFEKCSVCEHPRYVKGVRDRLTELEKDPSLTVERPPYIHQVPLEYIPGLGPKTLEKLKDHFKTEMDILHHVSLEAFDQVISPKISNYIIQARKGMLQVKEGGGGSYGKIKS